MTEEIRVWLSNAKSFHHRIMARYLEKRGWVVFYLDEDVRTCSDVCWLGLYEAQRRKESEKEVYRVV
jgi:hypothetical protein